MDCVDVFVAPVALANREGRVAFTQQMGDVRRCSYGGGRLTQVVTPCH